jgi:hypothetical protein
MLSYRLRSLPDSSPTPSSLQLLSPSSPSDEERYSRVQSYRSLTPTHVPDDLRTPLLLSNDQLKERREKYEHECMLKKNRILGCVSLRKRGERKYEIFF